MPSLVAPRRMPAKWPPWPGISAPKAGSVIVMLSFCMMLLLTEIRKKFRDRLRRWEGKRAAAAQALKGLRGDVNHAEGTHAQLVALAVPAREAVLKGLRKGAGARVLRAG